MDFEAIEVALIASYNLHFENFVTNLLCILKLHNHLYLALF